MTLNLIGIARSRGGGGDLSAAVILAPDSSARNIIQASGNFIPLTLLRNASGSTANTLVIGNESGTILTNFTAAGNLHIGGDITGQEGFNLTVQGTTGGFSLRRTGTNEPFILLSTDTALSGAQIRGLNAGGMRFTDVTSNSELMTMSGLGVFLFRQRDTNSSSVGAFSISHNLSSGTPAANMGMSLFIRGQSNNVNDRGLSEIRSFWIDATDATRKARAVWGVYDTVVRDAISIEASGSAAMIGFYSATPVVQPVNTTAIDTLLVNLGLRASGGTSNFASALTVLSDTDATTILGRARIDSRGTDIAYFSHFDMTASASYALRQNAGGQTLLNAASGQSLGFRINDGGVASFSSTLFTITVQTNPVISDATTLPSTLVIGHTMTDTPANNDGVALEFQTETSTTDNARLGRLRYLWTDITHATRTSNAVLSVVNAGTETDVLTLTPTVINTLVNVGIGEAHTGSARLRVVSSGGFNAQFRGGAAAEWSYATINHAANNHVLYFGVAGASYAGGYKNIQALENFILSESDPMYLGGETYIRLVVGGSEKLRLAATLLTFADAVNIALGTTTGTKIGTATSQKLSLWNVAPDVQPTNAIAAAAFVANSSGIADDTATWGGYTAGQIVAALKRIGALA